MMGELRNAQTHKKKPRKGSERSEVKEGERERSTAQRNNASSEQPERKCQMNTALETRSESFIRSIAHHLYMCMRRRMHNARLGNHEKRAPSVPTNLRA
jgi:hypothetical protein